MEKRVKMQEKKHNTLDYYRNTMLEKHYFLHSF